MNRNEKYLILFFLFLTVVFRFYVISLPAWHTKELFQVDMAKQLAANHLNILKTSVSFIDRSVSWNENPPYLWTEDFPMFNLISAVFIQCLPLDPVKVGRVIGFVFFAIGLLFFYLFLRKRYSEHVAVWALLLFSLAPISLTYSTYFIPDMAMVACFMGALYFLFRFFENKKKLDYCLALICAVGITSFRYYGTFLFLPLFSEWVSHKKIRSKYFLIFFLAPAVIPAFWLGYTFSFMNHPIEGHNHWGNWKEFLWDSSTYYRQMFLRLSKYSVSFVGWIFLMGGVLLCRKDVFLMTSIPMMILSLVIFTMGHANHEYYQLKFIPFLVIWTAVGIVWWLTKFKKYSFYFSLGLLLIFGFLSLRQTYKLLRYDSGPQVLGEQVRKWTSLTDKLVVIQDVPDPGVFVYGNRQGWMLYPEILTSPSAPMLYEKGNFIVVRMAETTLLKNIDKTLGTLSQLKSKYLTVWEDQLPIGKHQKCGEWQFFTGQCPREKYYMLILKR